MDITLELLETITDNFSEAQHVGSGVYGNVYRGVYNGQEIAVKKLHALQGLDDKAFASELLNITKVSHQNIARLIGYCYEHRRKPVTHNGKSFLAIEVERVLCSEYIEGRSLDKHINGESSDLDWPTCYKIIKGTCEGLNHLHNSQESPIFHLDLNPANVLLDKSLTAKIGDLGLSRLLAYSENHKHEVRKGTYGYVPPEYIYGGHISKKFDVFSLGVIILKIMAGNKGYLRCYGLPPEKFTELVISNWKERLQSTSGHLSQEINILRAKACVNIALRCVDRDEFTRPYVNSILNELEELESKKQLPVQSYQQEGSFGEHYRLPVQSYQQEGSFGEHYSVAETM